MIQRLGIGQMMGGMFDINHKLPGPPLAALELRYGTIAGRTRRRAAACLKAASTSASEKR